MQATRKGQFRRALHECAARTRTGSGVAVVIVTRNRPLLLSRCLAGIREQSRAPDSIFVVDDAGACDLEHIVEQYPRATLLRLTTNQGPAAAFGAGISAALADGADFIWMMDDDGLPGGQSCLALLHARAQSEAADLVSPLICDIADMTRLAFPIRRHGRTRFTIASLGDDGPIHGFAHLFNGALVRAHVFAKIGLPDPRFFIRGDEVEFLLRMRRHRLRIVTDPSVTFFHPASGREIRPILGGRFYAVVPEDPLKRYHQFRNRGWIFSHYGLWFWLAADHARYACWFLGEARDPQGYRDWLRITWAGVFGRFSDAEYQLATTPQRADQPDRCAA